VKQAGSLRGRLMLVHGMVDDNVHPANAWQLASALQSLDIPFEMMFFPDSAHGIGSPSMQRIRWSFLQDALGATPTEE
jgi:dipeptidyl-peptidase-4